MRLTVRDNSYAATDNLRTLCNLNLAPERCDVTQVTKVTRAGSAALCEQVPVHIIVLRKFKDRINVFKRDSQRDAACDGFSSTRALVYFP
jgi:hypothetical protein